MSDDAVVFRRDREGNVFALFPDLRATADGHCVSYQRVGQHSAADYALSVAHSRPARPEDYAELKAELEGLGYTLKVCKRRTSRRAHP